jgi:Tyrosine phosphatase family
MNRRVVVWEGCTNVRDLGGLRTCDGRMTRWRVCPFGYSCQAHCGGLVSALCTWHPYNR